jgi:hypothetical protein
MRCTDEASNYRKKQEEPRANMSLYHTEYLCGKTVMQTIMEGTCQEAGRARSVEDQGYGSGQKIFGLQIFQKKVLPIANCPDILEKNNNVRTITLYKFHY